MCVTCKFLFIPFSSISDILVISGTPSSALQPPPPPVIETNVLTGASDSAIYSPKFSNSYFLLHHASAFCKSYKFPFWHFILRPASASCNSLKSSICYFILRPQSASYISSKSNIWYFKLRPPPPPEQIRSRYSASCKRARNLS